MKQEATRDILNEAFTEEFQQRVFLKAHYSRREITVK
jgi:hypothetical protein